MADHDPGKQVQARTTSVVGSADAPTILADGYSGLVVANNVVRFRLVQSIIDDEGNTVRRVSGHLAMPLESFVSIHAAMTETLHNMISEGLIQVEEEGDASAEESDDAGQ